MGPGVQMGSAVPRGEAGTFWGHWPLPLGVVAPVHGRSCGSHVPELAQGPFSGFEGQEGEAQTFGLSLSLGSSWLAPTEADQHIGSLLPSTHNLLALTHSFSQAQQGRLEFGHQEYGVQ